MKKAPDAIKKLAVDNFSRYIDECIEEFEFRASPGFAPTIEEVEKIWGDLLERSQGNISELISNLVSNSEGDELIQEVKKKIRRISTPEAREERLQTYFDSY